MIKFLTFNAVGSVGLNVAKDVVVRHVCVVVLLMEVVRSVDLKFQQTTFALKYIVFNVRINALQ